jgi:hypothetical protein
MANLYTQDLLQIFDFESISAQTIISQERNISILEILSTSASNDILSKIQERSGSQIICRISRNDIAMQQWSGGERFILDGNFSSSRMTPEEISHLMERKSLSADLVNRTYIAISFSKTTLSQDAITEFFGGIIDPNTSYRVVS